MDTPITISRRHFLYLFAGLLGWAVLIDRDLAGPSDEPVADSRRVLSRQPAYTLGLTPELISETPDEDVQWLIADYVMDTLPSDYSDWPEGLMRARKGLRALYANIEMEGEVSNGGFSQYFFNSSGANAYLALESLSYFDMPEIREIFERVIDLEKKKGTPCSFFQDSAARSCEYDVTRDYADFTELDDEFFRHNDEMHAIRLARIRATPWEFTAPPVDWSWSQK
jgi:hypothetical protein